MVADDDAGSEGEVDGPESYTRLIERYRQHSYLKQAEQFLEWDQRVMMPEAGTPARAKQLSTISTVAQEKLASENIGVLLDAVRESKLTEDQRANVREIRREYERSRRVPSGLTGQITEHASETRRVWTEAKERNEYDLFAPRLRRLRDLHVRRAEAINPNVSPYQIMYEDSHPYIDIETVDEILDEIRSRVPRLVDAIRESDVQLATVEKPTDEAAQREICERILDFLGYDRSRGRLDISQHRFMVGNQFDVRITTRFNDKDPLDPVTGTIHEFGHATYQLGLPEEYGTPFGESRGSIHESQSRFWENHVGRSKAFWEGFLPLIDDMDGFDVTPQEAYEAVNQIYPNNLFRVEADELTYHLHILLRVELGRALVEGELAIEDLPDAWANKMETYLGVRPETDFEGCLQDVHWTGRFAAFQTYTIGSILAAQLDATIREDLDVDDLVREGRFEPIHDWMQTHIHSQGKRYTTPELIERVTGSPLSAADFLNHLETKFAELYDINVR